MKEKIKSIKKELVVLVILLLSFVFITLGISYAFLTYVRQGSTENAIITCNVTFVYDEKNALGN